MFDPITAWIEWKVQSLMIAIAEALCQALWYAQKAIGWLGDQMMSATAWQAAVTGMFNSVKTTMPSALRTIMFGTGGGLFYLAIIAVGFVLIVPQMVRSGNRPAELDRVLMWSIFVIALFISSTAGYDLIVSVETARQDVPLTMAGSFSGGSQTLSNLVAAPMSATAAEVNVSTFALPALFETTYFPTPSAFATQEIVFYDAPLLGSNRSTITIETDASLEYRRDQATLGIVLAVINSIPAAMVLTILLALAALTASALVLLLFFVMGLPLGLFEFGQAILAQIFKRYLLLWMLSVLIGAFPAILINTSGMLLTPPVSLSSFFTYLLLLIIALIACAHLNKLVFAAATASFSLIGHSINSAAVPYASGFNMPTPRRVPPHHATGSLIGAGLAGGAFSAATPWIASTVATGTIAAGAGIAGAAAYGLYNRRRGQSGSSNNGAVTVWNSAENGLSATPRPAHVFAYLDDPDVVEGEWEAIRTQHLTMQAATKELGDE